MIFIFKGFPLKIRGQLTVFDSFKPSLTTYSYHVSFLSLTTQIGRGRKELSCLAQD